MYDRFNMHMLGCPQNMIKELYYEKRFYRTVGCLYPGGVL